jgi:NADPH:quinone reductase-like Zn-dependent oxidoreductase
VIAETGAIAPMPANLDFDEAAAIPFGGATALNFLRDKAGIKPGDKVLVIGASGSVGSAAVQVAKALGGHVTATASAAKLDMVRDLGADHVIDHSVENPALTEAVQAHRYYENPARKGNVVITIDPA